MLMAAMLMLVMNSKLVMDHLWITKGLFTPLDMCFFPLPLSAGFSASIHFALLFFSLFLFFYFPTVISYAVLFL